MCTTSPDTTHGANLSHAEMRKDGYCAHGAGLVLTILERLQPGDRETLFQLQVGLSLFQTCYPPTRIAYWKRRIRRCLRALNALHDHQQLLHWVAKQPLSPEERAGARRVQLRLSQQIERLKQRADQAWQALLDSHALNEIRGLSQRWVELHAKEAPCPQYTEREWTRFVREHRPALHAETMALETRWGRLHALIVGAELMGIPVPCEWHTAFQTVAHQRFIQTAQTILQNLWEAEQHYTQQYYGHTRSLSQLRAGWESLQKRAQAEYS